MLWGALRLVGLARPHRSESDVHQLVAPRETASRLKLITKRGRRLATSRRGRELVGDPVALWRAIAATIGAVDDFSSMLSELISHRLLGGPAVGDELAQAIAPIIVAQDWAAGGVPLDEQQAGWAIHRPLHLWRLFGLLEEVRPRWESNRPTGPDVSSLNAVGRATALAYLYARATGPRREHPRVASRTDGRDETWGGPRQRAAPRRCGGGGSTDVDAEVTTHRPTALPTLDLPGADHAQRPTRILSRTVQ